MRNPIVKSTVIVFLFWWAVIYITGILTGLPRSDHPGIGLFQVGFGVLVASIVIWLIVVGGRWAAQGGLDPVQRRGVQSTIGIVPGADDYPRGKVTPAVLDPARWPKVVKWRAEAQAEYRAAFDAVLGVMLAKPDWPAAPVKGGHGGATLYQHCLNVVEYGLEKIDDWKLDRKNKDPLNGSSLHEDDRQAAMIVLLAHDMGKLQAYRIDGGKVTEWKRSHDREGARMLASLKEVWLLPEDDRQAIIAACAHEHHPQDLPTHTGEKARLLMEFLIDMDTGASRREENKPEVAEQGAQVQAADHSKEEDDDLWQWFLDAIAKPNAINGNDKRLRIGFKDGDGRIFFNEDRLRKFTAADYFKDDFAAEEKFGDGRYRLTERLLRIFDEQGVLVKEHDGQRFAYKSALFRAVVRGKDGGTIGAWAATIILDLKDKSPAGLARLGAAPKPPEIDRAVFPQRALRAGAKEEDAGQEEILVGNQSAVEVSDETDEASSITGDTAQVEAAVPADEVSEGGDESAESARAENVQVAKESEAGSASEGAQEEAAGTVTAAVTEGVTEAQAENRDQVLAEIAALNDLAEASWEEDEPALPHGRGGEVCAAAPVAKPAKGALKPELKQALRSESASVMAEEEWPSAAVAAKPVKSKKVVEKTVVAAPAKAAVAADQEPEIPVARKRQKAPEEHKAVAPAPEAVPRQEKAVKMAKSKMPSLEKSFDSLFGDFGDEADELAKINKQRDLRATARRKRN